MLDYKGFKDVNLNNELMAQFYSDLNQNWFGCLENEYLIVRDTGNEIKDYYKWTGDTHERIMYRSVRNDFTGELKPRNPQQILALDMLMDAKTTVNVLTGRFGTGKDYMMVGAALSLIKKGLYERIVFVRNNIEVKNTRSLGALPGEAHNKMLPFAMPLVDHVGGLDGLQQLMRDDLVEVVHLGYIRGRDIKNSIILCTEVENMSKEHCQLLIGRVGEGSALWLNGDTKQIDDRVFEKDNGLQTTVDRLKGHKRFGYVRLEKTERSETAAMADLLD